MSRALVIAAILVLGSAATACAEDTADGGSGDAARGEAAYVSVCARCHASVGRIVRRIEGDTSEEKEDWLHAFLPGHHAPEDGLRADLIAFLLGR